MFIQTPVRINPLPSKFYILVLISESCPELNLIIKDKIQILGLDIVERKV